LLSLETLDSYSEDNCYEVARIAGTDIHILNSPEGIAFDSTKNVATEGGYCNCPDPYAIGFDLTPVE